jgi:hypothetical protein
LVRELMQVDLLLRVGKEQGICLREIKDFPPLRSGD